MPSHKPFPKAHAKGMQNLQSAANHPLGDSIGRSLISAFPCASVVENACGTSRVTLAVIQHRQDIS
jgi:hypothetical protein